MMISSVSSASYAPPAAPPVAPPKQVAAPQDSVQLSPAAKAAAGIDADHDGDSH